MTEYDKIYDFQNLYKAHTRARLNKRSTREVIEFEMNLARNLSEISTALKDRTYRLSGYYFFKVFEPKERNIHALHYRDRVVQHCICDEVIAPAIEKRLIYDNAACRQGKGTHFAMNRLSSFMRKFYTSECWCSAGYFLKCDIRKFFDSIDHEVLKTKLRRVFDDEDVLKLLYMIIDSYEVTPGKGLPLGNQTSQWFALYYLDGMDRLVKEQLRIKYYTRYMDDCVLVHGSRHYLKYCLKVMHEYVSTELKLDFNEKTQIMPMASGVDYLGFHFYITETGKVIRRLRSSAKKRYKRRFRSMKRQYASGGLKLEDIGPVVNSYHAHLSHGHTYRLRRAVMKEFVLRHRENTEDQMDFAP